MKTDTPILEMKHITKRFPGVIANESIDFEVRKGEIHALVGENGAGKTTLMKILFGLNRLEEGEIFVKGVKLVPKSPRDAIALGMGMVQQHFTLVSAFSVVENIVLGLKSSRQPLLDLASAKSKIMELSERFGLEVEPDAKVWQLGVGEQQRVEILKALYRGADILILDEPTAVLTPQEVDVLFKTLRSMVEKGLTIIFITHKLPEVLAVSDRATVLRKGKAVATLNTRETNERELALLMVGREILTDYPREKTQTGEAVLELKSLNVLSDRGLHAVESVSLQVHAGEIVGIAGVAGNGQRELVEAATGLRRVESGQVLINGEDLTNHSPVDFIKRGVGYIPENRLSTGVITDFTVSENFILTTHSEPPYAARGWLNFDEINSGCDKLISEYGVTTTSKDACIRTLSGGNIQKLITGRELSRNPRLLVADKPTRGLDVGCTEYIHCKLLEARKKRIGILLVSEDLDEILSLSDRIAVMHKGKIIGIVAAEGAKIEEIGLMMAGSLSSP